MIKKVAFFIALSCAASRTSWAQENTSEQEFEGPWRFEIAPYAWLPVSTAGELTIPGNTLSFRTHLRDLLKNFKLGFSLEAEAWYKRFGLLFDGMFLRLGAERTRENVVLDLEFTQAIGEIDFAYRVADAPLGHPSDGTRIGIEVFAGGRVIWIKTELSSSLNLGIEPSSSDVSFEPVIGVQTPIQISREWEITLEADIGGFGVGSELTWNTRLDFEYACSDLFAFRFGYRIQGIDESHQAGERELTSFTTTHGPVLAAAFRF